MKKIILLLLVLLSPASFAQEKGPWVSIDVPEIDFGYITEYGTAIHRFWIRSNIDRPLRLGESKTFCDCLSFKFSDSTLNPDDSVAGQIILDDSRLVGRNHWVPAVYTDRNERIARVDVKAVVVPDPSRIEPIYVKRGMINASWFSDEGPREFSVDLVNVSDDTIPLKLIEVDTTYFSLDFPVYIKGGDTREITVRLKDKGIENDFEESITFEFIDNVTSQKKHYTVPVKRKLFHK